MRVLGRLGESPAERCDAPVTYEEPPLTYEEPPLTHERPTRTRGTPPASTETLLHGEARPAATNTAAPVRRAEPTVPIVPIVNETPVREEAPVPGATNEAPVGVGGYETPTTPNGTTSPGRETPAPQEDGEDLVADGILEDTPPGPRRITGLARESDEKTEALQAEARVDSADPHVP